MRRLHLVLFTLAMAAVPVSAQTAARAKPAMFYEDSSRLGRPFAKDPCVVEFHGRNLMYYTLPARTLAKAAGSTQTDEAAAGHRIASSTDLTHWNKIGEFGRNSRSNRMAWSLRASQISTIMQNASPRVPRILGSLERADAEHKL